MSYADRQWHNARARNIHKAKNPSSGQGEHPNAVDVSESKRQQIARGVSARATRLGLSLTAARLAMGLACQSWRALHTPTTSIVRLERATLNKIATWLRDTKPVKE